MTEQEYFEFVQRSLRVPGLDIVVEAQGWSPRRLLELAETLVAQEQKEARRQSDRSNVYDAAWVVIDVDEMAQEIGEVRRSASATNVKLAISNPCFEVWLVLHEENYTRPVERGEIQSYARRIGVMDANRPKAITMAKLEGNFEVAEKRAVALRTRHVSAGTSFPHDTPNTNVDELVRGLIAAANSSRPSANTAL